MAKAEAPLAEQAAYYRARAEEYDEWWQRRGRYDRGAEATRNWQDDVRALERALDRFGPSGQVLELASGTGWWTGRLARHAETLTCVDAAPETIEVNRRRLAEAELPAPRYVEADLFDWRPDARYDVVFFSFWLSHVPPERFDAFWQQVAAALKPDGRVFFIDSRPEQSASAQGQRPPDDDGIQERELNDGRSFRIVKLFYEPEALAERLAGLGWRATCAHTAHYFLHGEASRA